MQLGGDSGEGGWLWRVPGHLPPQKCCHGLSLSMGGDRGRSPHRLCHRGAPHFFATFGFSSPEGRPVLPCRVSPRVSAVGGGILLNHGGGRRIPACWVTPNHQDRAGGGALHTSLPKPCSCLPQVELEGDTGRVPPRAPGPPAAPVPRAAPGCAFLSPNYVLAPSQTTAWHQGLSSGCPVPHVLAPCLSFSPKEISLRGGQRSERGCRRGPYAPSPPRHPKIVTGAGLPSLPLSPSSPSPGWQHPGDISAPRVAGGSSPRQHH